MKFHLLRIAFDVDEILHHEWPFPFFLNSSWRRWQSRHSIVQSPVSPLSLLLLEEVPSYHLGHRLDQPYLLSEVFKEDHPLSPVAFRDQVLVLLLWDGSEVLEVLGRFSPVAAVLVVVVAAAVAAPWEVVLESLQAHPASRQT